MKKKILSSLLVLTLGAGIGVGAASLSLSEEAGNLKNMFGHNIEMFNQDQGKAAEELKQSESKRMEAETREYLSQRMQELKGKQEQQIKAETDRHIQSIKKFIDEILPK